MSGTRLTISKKSKGDDLSMSYGSARTEEQKIEGGDGGVNKSAYNQGLEPMEPAM